MNINNIFGGDYLTVKNTAVHLFFEYDECGKIFVTINVIGRVKDRKLPCTSYNNMELLHGAQVNIANREPLMRHDGSQHRLPRLLMLHGLTDDYREAQLEKLCRILRYSPIFMKLPRYVR